MPETNQGNGVPQCAPEDFDVILVTSPDIHGVSRGRFVFKSSFGGVARHGLGMAEAALCCGINCEVPENLTEFRDVGWANGGIVPDLSTLCPLTWLSSKHIKVGHSLCDMRDCRGNREVGSPRELVYSQIRALEDAGYTLRISSTAEFSLFYKGTLTPLPVHADTKQLFTNMIHFMRTSGIPVASVGMGMEPGKLQVSLEERNALEASDALHKLRNAVRCLCEKEGLAVTYMTRAFPGVSGNTISVKMRLRSKQSGGDAFRKGGDSNELSEVCKQWLSGLINHHDAVSALTRPTFNCHTQGENAKKNAWTLESHDDGSQRLVVSQSKEEGVAIEDRLPSSAGNAYVVVASLIAAGLDGVENKLEPFLMNDAPAANCPDTFENVLKSLEMDKELKRRLGETFHRRFLTMKRDYELARLINNEADTKVQDSLASLEFARSVYLKAL